MWSQEVAYIDFFQRGRGVLVEAVGEGGEGGWGNVYTESDVYTETDVYITVGMEKRCNSQLQGKSNKAHRPAMFSAN